MVSVLSSRNCREKLRNCARASTSSSVWNFAAEKPFFSSLILVRALSDRYEDSHAKAALKISVMKAEIESEQSNMDKTLNEVA